MTIKLDNTKNQISSDISEHFQVDLNDTDSEYTHTTKISTEDQDSQIDQEIIEYKNFNVQSEFKIIPKNNDKLCLIDPMILCWIIAIVAIILYIIGHKYKK
jgi:hypothetical protein